MIPAKIPSPSSGELHVGPVSLNAYGLMIALGVFAAVWLCGRLFERHRIGTRDDATVIGAWGAAAGVIGARLYHVVTDWDRFRGHPGDVVKVWEGGLGIPGGLLFGVGAGLLVARRRGVPLGLGLNCAAPSIALAQSVARWGNYFNQELFGGPTTLPWGLEVSPGNVPAGYAPDTLFHPAFLYESLWNLALCGALLWVDRRWRMAGGRLFALYLVGYGVGRFWIEGLRIDPAHEIAGLRLNQWVALAAVVGGAAWFVVTRRDAPPDDPAPLAAGTGSDGDDDGVDATSAAAAVSRGDADPSDRRTGGTSSGSATRDHPPTPS